MSNNSKNAMVAFLAGAAIGAGIGILFAPDKGSKTRKKLKEGFDDAKYNIQDKLLTVSKKIKNKIESAADDIEGNYENIISSLSYKTEDVISFLEDKLEDLKLKNSKSQN